MGSPLYQLQFHGKTYSATELSALVLQRLKADAELALGQDVDRAVITVPAYFGDAQRKATIEAGNAAGFQVMRIINEPTAATLAYGLNRATEGSETVLIYDLGGGTFDVTVARIAAEDITVLATAGDHDLGGKNWDDRIATFLAEQFAARDRLRSARRPGRAQRGAGSQRAGQVGPLGADVDPDHSPARLPARRASSSPAPSSRP